MKVTLFLSSLWLFIASLFAPETTSILSGNVSDGKEPLIGASIKVMRGTDFVRGTITDYNGDYQIQLEPGTYDVEYTYTGFKSQRIIGLRVIAEKPTVQNIILAGASTLNEVEIIDYKVPLIEQDKTSSGHTLTPEQIKNLPTREVKSIDATTVGASSVDGGDVNVKGTRSEGTDYYIDGVRVSGGVPPVEDKAIGTEITRETKPAGAKKSEKATGMGKSPEVPLKKADSTRPSSTESDDDKIKAEINPFRGNVFTTKKLDPEPGAPIAKTEEGVIIVEGRKKRMLVTDDPETYEEKVKLVDVEDGSESIADKKEETSMPTQPAPRAGLLTAGEWNDLHNWNRHWVDLLNDGEIDAYQKIYGFYPRQRYTVMLTNENGFPIADAMVNLQGSDEILWEARTDNTGKAELWAALFNPEKETAKLHAEVWVGGKKHEISKLKPAAEGFNYLKINAECNAPKNVDIVWAVDATGSMGDEIEYLKTELLDVIGRAKSRNPELNYCMGTVFYRDKGDEYITKSSGLSPDVANTVDFIQKQFAGGGGDYPEAVHSALEEAVFNQKWSENALARICFLVLDASPHQSPDVNASLQKSIREAARLGIRIVPIAASGIQKDTEFLMKFFGLATNGSYVFLTDHSGVGGKHLEPTTDEYKVEPLNNLLVRIITEYTSIETCEGKSEIRFEGDPQQQPGPLLQALYYPNPAVEQFTLELPFEVQSVTIYDSEGKAVRKVENPVAGPNVILVNDLAAGFYTIRILNNGRMQSGKLMVVRS
ncbi:MAG: carboxypeptidase regulatory-like domain-containing protein [Saprospiraceae bacterium]|nr:carboxypeptidase regulatory-like domain-containing protein [Saprospiraceae bacterium]